MKTTSAGLIITDGVYILACQPFGRKAEKQSFDIPKGLIENGELPMDAAIRECEEETSFSDIDIIKVQDRGIYKYRRDKDLHIFLYIVKELPKLENLQCTSYFEYNGVQVRECIGYKYVKIEEPNWFFPNLQKVIKNVLGIKEESNE